MTSNELVYGKNALTRIVSVEPGDDTATVFRELEDGSVVSETVPHSHYILYSSQYSPKMLPLKGDQPYKYMIEYGSKEKYKEVLSTSYQRRYDLYTIRNPKEAMMVKDGYTYFKGMQMSDVSVLSFDIEDTYGIGDTCKPDGKVLLIANTFRRKGKITKKQFAYDDFQSEGAMLEAWAAWVRQMNPAILLGHNVYGHDLKVLDFAARKASVKMGLGRDGSRMFISSRSSKFRKDGSQAYDYNNIQIYGREIVDTWFLAMKHDGAARREYESYGLKEVVKHEGLAKKDRVYFDASKIGELYKDPAQWKLIKAYNLDDADEPLSYYDLVIPSFFYYTQSIPRSFQQIINTATGSQINSLMVRSYLQQGHSIARASETAGYEGAISFGVPGIHKNVFKIDVQSLYPNIIMSEKIYNRTKDPQGLFLKLVEYFTAERIKNKEEFERTKVVKFDNLSNSQKIVCNSFYGFLAAKANYNYPEAAARITEIGRDILKTAIKWATGTDYVPELKEETEEDDAA
jgi:DNA polymerase elongation subunit (family B)